MTAVAQTDTSIFQLFVVLGIAHIFLKLDLILWKTKNWKRAAWFQRLRYHTPVGSGFFMFMTWLIDVSFAVSFWMLLRIFADGWDPANPATIPPIQTDPYANLFFTAFAFAVIYYFSRVGLTNFFFKSDNRAVTFVFFVLWGTQVVNFVLWIILYIDNVGLSALQNTFLIVMMVVSIVCVVWLATLVVCGLIASRCGDRHDCFKQHFMELKLKAKAKLDMSLGSTAPAASVGFPGILALFNQPSVKSHNS